MWIIVEVAEDVNYTKNFVRQVETEISNSRCYRKCGTWRSIDQPFLRDLCGMKFLKEDLERSPLRFIHDVRQLLDTLSSDDSTILTTHLTYILTPSPSG